LYEQLDQREFANNSFQSFTEHYVFLFDSPDAAQVARPSPVSRRKANRLPPR
jgi:hypothetical protein